MYLRYFGLNEAPFSITPDPSFVFLSPRHRDALAHLLYGIGQGGSGGFVQLTGEVGTGKTTLCRCLLEQIPDDTRIALLLNPLVTPRELLAAISEELGIDVSDSIDSTRLLVDGLNRYLLDAHKRGERVVVVIDEAQNLSPEALEQVRLLTNLETAKEKLLQIVLLGQPELRELLQRRNLRQLAQRITARYHLSPLGPKDTHLYVAHRMQVAGAQRNPFRRGAMNALYQRSQGIPRLINIIADRSLVAAFAKERMDVTASMVHGAANEVQLGENRVKRVRWPWFLAAAAVVVVAVVTISTLYESAVPAESEQATANNRGSQKAQNDQPTIVAIESPIESVVETGFNVQSEPVMPVVVAAIDTDWLSGHQLLVWQGFAELWRHPGAAFSIEAACNGDNSRGYACLNDQGSWSKIKRLGLPVVLVLQGQTPIYLLLHGIDGDRLQVGTEGHLQTVSKESVEDQWLGAYQVVWPQASEWPATVKRGDSGSAVNTIMEMATRVDVPYHGEKVFDAGFESWLRSYQVRNGLEVDGIVGRKTLLYLMTASIDDPRLLQSW
jgi:general secretion pathway protein A